MIFMDIPPRKTYLFMEIMSGKRMYLAMGHPIKNLSSLISLITIKRRFSLSKYLFLFLS